MTTGIFDPEDPPVEGVDRFKGVRNHFHLAVETPEPKSERGHAVVAGDVSQG